MNTRVRERSIAAVTYLGAVALLSVGLLPGASRAIVLVADTLGVSVGWTAADAVAGAFTLWVAFEVTAIRLYGIGVLRRGARPVTLVRYAALWLSPVFVLFHPVLVPIGRWLSTVVTAGHGPPLMAWAVLGLCVAGVALVAVRTVRGAIRGYRAGAEI